MSPLIPYTWLYSFVSTIIYNNTIIKTHSGGFSGMMITMEMCGFKTRSLRWRNSMGKKQFIENLKS